MSGPVLVDARSGDRLSDGWEVDGLCSGDLRSQRVDGPAPLWADFASRIEIDWSEAVA